MGRIKGAAIRARLEFVRSRYGENALHKVVSGLDEMDQVVLSGTILPSIWYPFQVLADFDDAVRRELGGGAEALFEEAGEAVARQHARSIYKVFFHETAPERVLRVAACIFGNYYSGLGRVDVKPGTDGLSTSVRVLDASTASRAHCSSSVSYFRTVVEACTGRPVQAREAHCRCWGDDACEFEFSWQPALKTAAGQ